MVTSPFVVLHPYAISQFRTLPGFTLDLGSSLVEPGTERMWTKPKDECVVVYGNVSGRLMQMFGKAGRLCFYTDSELKRFESYVHDGSTGTFEQMGENETPKDFLIRVLEFLRGHNETSTDSKSKQDLEDARKAELIRRKQLKQE